MRQPGACVSSTFPPLGIVFSPFHPRQQLTAVVIYPNHLLNPSTPSPLAEACVPATAGTHAKLLEWIYTFITGRCALPPRLLAHSGARYDISDLREIYGAGRRNSTGSSGGCSLGGGAQSAPFWYIYIYIYIPLTVLLL